MKKINKILMLVIIYMTVGCSDCILMYEGNYCMDSNDCNTGQTCFEGECQNFMTGN